VLRQQETRANRRRQRRLDPTRTLAVEQRVLDSVSRESTCVRVERARSASSGATCELPDRSCDQWPESLAARRRTRRTSTAPRQSAAGRRCDPRRGSQDAGRRLGGPSPGASHVDDAHARTADGQFVGHRASDDARAHDGDLHERIGDRRYPLGTWTVFPESVSFAGRARETARHMPTRPRSSGARWHDEASGSCSAAERWV
jgi:hypothetical protein